MKQPLTEFKLPAVLIDFIVFTASGEKFVNSQPVGRFKRSTHKYVNQITGIVTN